MKYLRRVVWYIAGRMFLITLVLGLMILGFYYAMNFTNIQVVLKDGMAQRTKIIMQMDTDKNAVGKFFSSSWLDKDTVLSAALQGNSNYSDYNVRGIDHRLEMSFFWVWPWETTARVNVQETVPRIDGRVKGTKADAVIATKGDRGVYPPDWTGARYRVTLSKENGQWKIRNLSVLEYLEPQ